MFWGSSFKLWIFVHDCQNFVSLGMPAHFEFSLWLYLSTHDYPISWPRTLLSCVESILVHSHPSGSHFCRYVQMDNIGSASADVEAWTLVNYLEEGGFPALLWDTLKKFGYTAYPEYSTREVMTTGQLFRCEVKVEVSVCPTNPVWEEWECKAQGRNLADTVQKVALEALTTFCGRHPDEVADTSARVIPIPERHTVPCV
jgi:hypothetical protein